MAIRALTDSTGKRMAAAMENLAGVDSASAVKIPHIDNFDFKTIANYAKEYGHSSNQEIQAMPFAGTATAGSPLLNFLKGLAVLSDFDNAEDGRVAYCSYSFMKLLLFEASRFNHNALVKTTDGLVSRIDNCTLKEIGNEVLPSTFSFLILGSGVVKGLNELEAQGLLDDADALNALLEENQDAMYYHYGCLELNVLPMTVLPGDAGKMIIRIDRDREISTNKWFYITAEDFYSLPDVAYGTSIDVSTSSSGWYGSYELQDSAAIDTRTWEITPPSGHTAIKLVEVLRTMKPVAVRSKTIAVGE